MSRDHSSQPVRLDKWLWAARFFKTRRLATEAVKGGKVHVDGQRAKRARAVHVGERLTIRKGPVTFEIVVDDLAERRGPAREAEKLYTETAESRQRREEEAAMRKAVGQSLSHPAKRPSKRDRRHLIRFKKDRQ